MLIERFWRGLSGNIQKKLHFLKNIFVFSEKRVTFASTKKTNTMRTETTNYSMGEIFGCGIDFEEGLVPDLSRIYPSFPSI